MSSAEEIGFNRYTILNLHAMLANNLLADPAAAGRLRRIAVSIDGRMDKKSASAHLAAWSEKNIEPADRERFREIAETELLGLHEGNFARYQIRPSDFLGWQEVWK